LDADRLIECARSASPLELTNGTTVEGSVGQVRVGYFRDSVFTFYYPENLEALEAQGAELVPVSSLHDAFLPEIDALYIGGGFPEVHAERLARNRPLMESVRRASERGLPVYAECGGLIYLSRSVTFQGNSYPMAGVFDVALDVHSVPVGHGYSLIRVDRPCPFFPMGTEIRGHEFHYSGATERLSESTGCMAVVEGVGLGNGRDGLLKNNTLASYTHLHALGVRGWAGSMISCAARYRREGRLLTNATNVAPMVTNINGEGSSARVSGGSGGDDRPDTAYIGDRMTDRGVASWLN
jgi:cobyrinic acid a,c-diamide synthase